MFNTTLTVDSSKRPLQNGRPPSLELGLLGGRHSHVIQQA